MSSSVTRRDVLRGALAAAALAACGGASPRPSTSSSKEKQPAQPKRILILGGTGFLGPKTIDVALARGHSVTIFNRGKREKIQPLEQKVEHLYGNRDPKLPADEKSPEGSPVGLEQLEGKKWDVVIDNSGYFPRHVEASAKLLAPNAERYIYISSISAYAENPATGGDETTKLAELADPTVESMGDNFENYGGLKVLCERAAAAAFGADRAAIVRPGFIVGPGDPTDRFTYWPARIAAGGEVLAPGSPDDPLQWIDVRDLAEFLVTLAEQGTAGTFNAIGPDLPARWGTVLDTCVTASGSGAKLTWVPTSWLEKHEMAGEDAFPIWVPPADKFAGFHRWKNERAKAAGLTFRTIDDTVKSLLAWFPTELERRVRVTRELVEGAKARGDEPPKMADPTVLRAGPTREREAELLAAFHTGK
ncbi:MAG: NAD-dependent epimerase/dehydratase family protein [Kofleriaceae bacterium]|nr:NAD-dependent epimerase/dehydratase family protein [Kofleriaceae bacterium]